MKLQDLFEIPRLIPSLSTEDNLDINSINRSKYLELIKVDKEIYKKFDDKRIVYQSGMKFFCLDAERKEVTYYMEFSVSNNKLLGSFLWQSLVWRSKLVKYNKTLPHEIFFDTLLPKYGVIVTDGEQTPDGERFWTYQIAYALSHDLYLYYHHLSTKELVPFYSMLEFDKLAQENDIWGLDPDHKQKLIVISTKDFLK